MMALQVVSVCCVYILLLQLFEAVFGPSVPGQEAYYQCMLYSSFNINRQAELQEVRMTTEQQQSLSLLEHHKHRA